MQIKNFLSFGHEVVDESNSSKKTTIEKSIKDSSDNHLIFSTSGLLIISLIMVYSASLDIASGSKMTNYNGYYFFTRHLVSIVLGVLAGFVVYKIPLIFWEKNALNLFFVGSLVLILVLIPGIGKEVNGAQRWINLGFFNFQPSELMKLLTVLYAADYINRKRHVLDNLKLSFFPILTVTLFVGFLLLQQPDFGAFIVISFIAFSVLFLGGVKLIGFFSLIALAVAGFVVIIITSPYRLARVVGFLDPWADPYGKGYQLSHSLIAFGRGEFSGVGLGKSIEKLFYLPEAHTDFIMAVIGEEFGFIGVLIIISLFATFVYRAFQIGNHAHLLQRDFGSLVAKGIGIWFGFQAFINIGVNLGLLPTKGLTLPLMSFGGTGIIVNLMAVAILLRIDMDNRKLLKHYKNH